MEARAGAGGAGRALAGRRQLRPPAARLSRVLLVRHADAGAPRPHDDHLRSLTALGRDQAEGLAARLYELAPDGIVLASPARRCQETLAPLAALRGRTVEVAEALAEGAGLAALDLARASGTGAVLCTHGPVLHDILAALDRQGVPGVQRRAEVASAWLLDLEGERVKAAAYLAPGG